MDNTKDILERMKTALTEATGLTWEQIWAKDRHEPVVAAKQLAVYFYREKTGIGFNKMGCEFDVDYDRTSINYCYLTAKDRILYDPLFRDLHEKLVAAYANTLNAEDRILEILEHTEIGHFADFKIKDKFNLEQALEKAKQHGLSFDCRLIPAAKIYIAKRLS